MDRPFKSDDHVANLSSPLPHRMPSISAAQALASVTTPSAAAISTGVTSLDRVLMGAAAADNVGNDRHALEGRGGVGKGHVTEIYGPPGVGKTALGLQLCVNTLKAGQGVVWVDAGNQVSGARLQRMLRAAMEQIQEVDPQAVQDGLENLTHYSTPSLAHLMALLCHSGNELVSSNTALVVVDSLSSLVSSTYTKHTDPQTHKPAGQLLKNDPQQWASSRKWSVLQYLITSLQRLAALRNVAIVLLNQTATKMQSGMRAQLVPVISSPAWEAGIATRLVLFRDWGWEGQQVRLAGVLKSRGAILGAEDGVGRVVPFAIDEDGLHDCSVPTHGTAQTPQIVTGMTRKRKANEIQDSEDDEGSDEDYGWADEIVQEMPVVTQYQGSEDILVPGPQERIEEEDDGDASEDGLEDEGGDEQYDKAYKHDQETVD